MKLRLGAILLAALIPLTAVTVATPANAGVDTTPPPVGSCHQLTLDEAFKASDPDPAVACSRNHTSLTYAVLRFGEAPNWNSDALKSLVSRRCLPKYVDALGGNAKAVQLSAHASVWFIPTKAQRDAGATWVRCDLALSGGDRTMRLQENVELRLPLPDAKAKCRKGRSAEYVVTVCSRGHQLRATHALKHPGNSYPGARRMIRWTIRECAQRLGRSFGFYEPVTKAQWRLGLHFSICYKKSSR